MMCPGGEMFHHTLRVALVACLLALAYAGPPRSPNKPTREELERRAAISAKMNKSLTAKGTCPSSCPTTVDIANALLGGNPTLSISNVQLTATCSGVNSALSIDSSGFAGTYFQSVFQSGALVLSSGDASAMCNPNAADYDNNLGLRGDTDLETAISQNPTYDATIVTFTLTSFVQQSVVFDYMFATGDSYPDGAAIFVDNINVAVNPTNVKIGDINDFTRPSGTAASEVTSLRSTTPVLVNANAQVTVKIVVADGGDEYVDSWLLVKIYKIYTPICFPASSTVRRIVADTPDTWETVAMPELRIGDTVECLAREPVFGDNDGTVTSAAYGRLTRCTVYGYKKALPAEATTTPYTRITYEAAEGPDTPAGAVAMSSNHHLLDPATGQARQAGGLRAGDYVLRATPSGAMVPARVASVATVQDGGAYVPLLSGGGLPIVDGVVAYPSSGESDVGLDAKHWGQHFLHAPLWQALPDEAGSSNGAALPAHGRSLSELGAQEPVAPFTKKWHAVGAAAAREGRSSCGWAGVAAEMHAAIKQGKRYTEAEALGVLDRHHSAPRGVAEA